MKKRMTIKEAVRRSIYDFLKEDVNSKAASEFIKDQRKKRHDFETDEKDEPLRGADAGEDDPFTKFNKRIKRH